MMNQSIESKALPASSPAAEVPADQNDIQVARYRTWLNTQANRDGRQDERNEYARRAAQAVEVANRKIQTFAPFRYKYSALQTITPKQCAVLGLIGLLLAAGLVWHWTLTLVVVIAIITAGYLLHLILDFALALGAARQPAEEHIDEKIIMALKDAAWPPYTILCPLYKEARVVPQFVKAMQALDYPEDKLQILFLTEEDDDETRDAIRAMCLPSHFRTVTVPDGSPRTKPRACNYGLIEATGDFVVIYDAEDVPDPLQLKKAVLVFANHDPDLACVQAKLNFYNPNQNLLTRWFTAEYSLWFDLILPGLQQTKLAIPLGGTSNHFPTQTLRALGGWDAFNVTEDCDLGLRLAWFRLETVVLDSTTYEEANSGFKNWIRQRSRWIKGYMQTYLVHMREPLHYLRYMRLREFFSLQLVIGGKTAVLLINPLMWIMLATSLIFRQVLANSYSFLFPAPILFISIICLVLGNFFYVYTYLLGCMKRKQYSLVKWMLLIPLYWLMASMAAYMALYQLFTKPHYWEKTVHGLHLNPAESQAIPDQEPVQQASEGDVTWKDLARLVEDLSPIPATLPALITADTPPSIQRYERLNAVPVASVQNTINQMIVPRAPAFLPEERAELYRAAHPKTKDRWFLVTLVSACALSVLACWYYFQQQQILLYTDASLHLGLARSVFSGALPFDITHLGGTWPPLPQILTLPFAWNDVLWHTGLAGSIPSMLAYGIAALYIFLFIRRLARDSRAAFVGALLFMLNPNMLYLQSTPSSVLIGIATFIMTGYYVLAWTQSDQLKHLLLAAGCIFLATLASYENWTVFLALLVLIPAIGWAKHQSREQISGNLLVFSLLGGLGIALWLLWCGTIFGDAFFFLHGLHSAHTQLFQVDVTSPYRSLWQALHLSPSLSAAIADSVLAILAPLAFAIFAIRSRFKVEMVAALALLIPLIFYGVSAYSGLNMSFGVQMLVPAIAIFLATLLGGWDLPARIKPGLPGS